MEAATFERGWVVKMGKLGCGMDQGGPRHSVSTRYGANARRFVTKYFVYFRVTSQVGCRAILG